MKMFYMQWSAVSLVLLATAACSGERGEAGYQGAPGVDGTDGADGAQGGPGEDGARGPRGRAGTPGADGADGAEGAAGQDGAPGFTSLFRWHELEPGDACSAGGHVLETGLDLDGSGVLDDEEVESEVYVCSGLNGQDGAPGASAPIRTQVELAGPGCTSGGLRGEVGPDLGRDGRLDHA